MPPSCVAKQQVYDAGQPRVIGPSSGVSIDGAWQRRGLGCADTKAESDEEGLQVDPSRQAPGVGDPAVKQPGPPTVPKN